MKVQQVLVLALSSAITTQANYVDCWDDGNSLAGEQVLKQVRKLDSEKFTLLAATGGASAEVLALVDLDGKVFSVENYETGQTPYPGLEKITPGPKKIDLGERSYCALTATGEIECFGTLNRNTGPPTNQGPYKDVCVGSTFSCAIVKDTGNVLCWSGVNFINAPGSGSTDVFDQVVCGTDFACAVKADETVTCIQPNTGDALSLVPTDARLEMLSASKDTICGLRTDSKEITCFGKTTGLGDISKEKFQSVHVGVKEAKPFVCGILATGAGVRCFGAFSTSPSHNGVFFPPLALTEEFVCGLTAQSPIPTQNAEQLSDFVSVWVSGALIISFVGLMMLGGLFYERNQKSSQTDIVPPTLGPKQQDQVAVSMPQMDGQSSSDEESAASADTIPNQWNDAPFSLSKYAYSTLFLAVVSLTYHSWATLQVWANLIEVTFLDGFEETKFDFADVRRWYNRPYIAYIGFFFSYIVLALVVVPYWSCAVRPAVVPKAKNCIERVWQAIGVLLHAPELLFGPQHRRMFESEVVIFLGFILDVAIAMDAAHRSAECTASFFSRAAIVTAPLAGLAYVGRAEAFIRKLHFDFRTGKVGVDHTRNSMAINYAFTRELRGINWSSFGVSAFVMIIFAWLDLVGLQFVLVPFGILLVSLLIEVGWKWLGTSKSPKDADVALAIVDDDDDESSVEEGYVRWDWLVAGSCFSVLFSVLMNLVVAAHVLGEVSPFSLPADAATRNIIHTCPDTFKQNIQSLILGPCVVVASASILALLRMAKLKPELVHNRNPFEDDEDL